MGAALLAIAAGEARAVEYPSPPPDFAHRDDPHSALYSFTGGRTDRPMLVIYAEFSDLTFADTSPSGLDAAYMADRFFGPFPSVADYFADDSRGRLSIAPAAESDASNNGAVDDGVVSVSIGTTKDEFLGLGRSAEQKALLEAADGAVDYSSFDSDGNGRVTQDELIVHRQDVDPDPAGPAGCATARRPESVQLDGVQLGGGGNLLMVNGGTDTNLMTLAHETGHAAFDMPDLYFWNVGSLDLAGPTCGIADASLFRTNAWQKMHLGWLAPTVVSADGYYDVPLTADSGDAFILYDPEKGTDDYFVVSNRAQASGTYDSGASDTGLVIWRLEDDAYTPNGAGEAELGPDGGFISLIRPGNDQAWDPSDPSTPERTMQTTWRDGTASNVAVRAIPAAGSVMRVFFDVRGPGILVDPFTPQGLPMRIDVTPTEVTRPPVPVTNTGEKADRFLFGFEALPSRWRSANDELWLGAGEGEISGTRIVPPADAPTGVREVTITGLSRSDPTIVSRASFELNVVLDRTEIAYTGPVEAPPETPVELSALVTNPDDSGSPPVRGVEVTFEVAGAGGTHTVAATTGTDGIATATTEIMLPSGEYQLTASTERHRKHAPGSVVSPFQLATPADRIEALLAEIAGLGLHGGTAQSIGAKLAPALTALEDERIHTACNTLGAFVNQVEALEGKRISEGISDELVTEVESIRSQLEC